jgi:membrane protein implicated in regulation of membrane protease activity
MSPLAKYILYQTPGWIAAAALLAALAHWEDLSAWLAAGLFVLWVAKDACLYPLLRRAYESDVPTGGARLVGCEGVARQRLAPEGYVLVNGELWRARTTPGSEPITSGAAVRVVASNRLTLTVVEAG